MTRKPMNMVDTVLHITWPYLHDCNDRVGGAYGLSDTLQDPHSICVRPVVQDVAQDENIAVPCWRQCLCRQVAEMDHLK